MHNSGCSANLLDNLCHCYIHKIVKFHKPKSASDRKARNIANVRNKKDPTHNMHKNNRHRMIRYCLKLMEGFLFRVFCTIRFNYRLALDPSTGLNRRIRLQNYRISQEKQLRQEKFMEGLKIFFMHQRLLEKERQKKLNKGLAIFFLHSRRKKLVREK